VKIINDIAAQGDVLFLRVEELPDGLTRVLDAAPVVAHSESGHHHRVRARSGYAVERHVQDAMTSYLRIRRTRDEIHARADAALANIDGAIGAVAQHEKQGPDAHEEIGLACEGDEAIYRVLRQQELRPEGWVAVQD
jgi:hypothetical protein